ncbi:hypothetical protein QCA50_017971 [Cerrena zonata]|uniref:Uncharacterized protein n=1 Tax=Cerrena zonata TaxID=2478898 RepID=A0AAW0FFL0_9APHY
MSVPFREGHGGNLAGSTLNNATSTAPTTGTTATRGPIGRGVQKVEQAAGIAPGNTTAGTGVGTGVGTGHMHGTGAGVGTGHTHGTGTTTGATTHHAPMGGTTGTTGATSHVPLGQKVTGSVEKAVGKVTNDPTLVMKGEQKKTGANVGTGGAGYGTGTVPGGY